MQEKSYVTIRQIVRWELPPFVDKMIIIVYTIKEVLYMFVFIVKDIRESKKISLNKLSEKTKISKSYLHELENNRKFNISLDKLYRIASSLDVNVKDLFYTSLDIEALRKELHDRINEYGLNSKETLEVSKLIDLLVNIKFKELD